MTMIFLQNLILGFKSTKQFVFGFYHFYKKKSIEGVEVSHSKNTLCHCGHLISEITHLKHKKQT